MSSRPRSALTQKSSGWARWARRSRAIAVSRRPSDARAKASRVTLASGSRSRSAVAASRSRASSARPRSVGHPAEGVAEPVPPGVGVRRLGDRDEPLAPRPRPADAASCG